MILLPKGHLSILDKRFRYVKSSETDVKATFERIRAAQKNWAGVHRLGKTGESK